MPQRQAAGRQPADTHAEDDRAHARRSQALGQPVVIVQDVGTPDRHTELDRCGQGERHERDPVGERHRTGAVPGFVGDAVLLAVDRAAKSNRDGCGHHNGDQRAGPPSGSERDRASEEQRCEESDRRPGAVRFRDSSSAGRTLMVRRESGGGRVHQDRAAETGHDGAGDCDRYDAAGHEDDDTQADDGKCAPQDPSATESGDKLGTDQAGSDRTDSKAGAMQARNSTARVLVVAQQRHCRRERVEKESVGRQLEVDHPREAITNQSRGRRRAGVQVVGEVGRQGSFATT